MSTTNPVAAVQQYVDAFNKGDGEAMAAIFALPGSILDGMPPHVCQGPTASQDWYRDVLIEGEQHGASDYFVTLGEPLHNTITRGPCVRGCTSDDDFQSTRPAGYANRRGLHSRASQVAGRMADRGLGLGERNSRVTGEMESRPCPAK